MGLYVGLRVKGVVKKEFRDEIKKIEEYGEWKKSKDIKFKEFSKIERANFIPMVHMLIAKVIQSIIKIQENGILSVTLIMD